MINKDNYFKHIERIGFEQLPEELKKAHLVIVSKTAEGKDWNAYDKENDFHQLVDTSLDKLKELLKSSFLNGLSPIEKKIRADAKKKMRADLKKYPFSYAGRELYTFQDALELQGKVVKREDLAHFIKTLQKNIQEKNITSKSPVAKEIRELQQFAIEKYNQKKAAVLFFMPEDMVYHIKELIARILDDNGKTNNLYNHVIHTADSVELSGTSFHSIIPSTDLVNMHFDTLGFKDKWLSFIGDPCKGFTAMVFGMPKTGKSYLCIEFANYLSLNHGKVLYVSKEEFMSPTLSSKLKDKNAIHANLDIAGSLPDDLSSYNFVFLDSVSSMKLSVDELKKLKEKNPNISFIYIFHVTKNGKARGTNEYMHNVDIVIQIPEKGKAVQFGRFNQGGSMDIFPEGEKIIPAKKEEALEGIKRKSERRLGNTELDYSDEFRVLKDLVENDTARKFTDPQFNEIFSIALKKEKLLKQMAVDLEAHNNGFLMIMYEAINEWGKNK
jgi:hypothetical protein